MISLRELEDPVEYIFIKDVTLRMESYLVVLWKVKTAPV